jgi:NhaP-type Na+/H+ or K+/H+ antiporter
MEMIIIVVGRISGVLGLIFLLTICGHKQQVTWRQLLFISYAGMIRGAIAFGLVLQIDGDIVKEKDVIVTTSLTLVAITTVFYGGTMPIV